MNGVLDKEYALQRDKKRALKYRLRRRADEAVQAIRVFYPNPEKDPRPGDRGRQDAFENQRKISLDHLRRARIFSGSPERGRRSFPEYILYSRGRADICRSSKMLHSTSSSPQRSLNILRTPGRCSGKASASLEPGGILIITTPHPFWERLSSHLGMIPGEHKSVMGFLSLRRHCLNAEFQVLEEKGFMISPIGFPGEQYIEGLLRRLKVDRHLANQLMVLRKPA